MTDLQHDRAEALALGNELDRVTRNLQIILDRSQCSCPAEEGQKPRRRGLCGWCKVSELREDMLRVRARDRRRP